MKQKKYILFATFQKKIFYCNFSSSKLDFTAKQDRAQTDS